MKQIIAVIAVIVIVAVGWLAFGGKKNDHKNSQANKPPSSQNQTNSADSSQSPQPAATDKVTIANMAFSPADITVKSGTSVTWTNNDSIAHTVTENDGQDGPNSSPLSQGQTYSFTFKNPGTYKYICSIHTEMTGSVTVTK